MNGLLVVNHFFQIPKFTELYEWFEKSASLYDINLQRLTNVECTLRLADKSLEEDIQFVLFWDKDTRLCSLLEQEGFRTFNTSEAIKICDDKSLTYLALHGTDIKQPKTIVVPQVFYPSDWRASSFSEGVISALGSPVVAKECFGSFGEQVRLAHNAYELDEILNSFNGRPAIIQEFIASSAGKDIRVQMVGTNAIAAMERKAQSSDFRSNITNGGTAEAVTPTSDQIAFAQKVMNELGLDFAGIDIMEGENGEPILCEVNSNAHFINLYNVTGVNTADAIMKYIHKTIKG